MKPGLKIANKWKENLRTEFSKGSSKFGLTRLPFAPNLFLKKTDWAAFMKEKNFNLEALV